MTRRRSERQGGQRAMAHLRRIQHYEQVTRNVSKTCRFFGISRSQFYEWHGRYQREGLPGLRDRKRGPKVSPWRTPPDIEGLILRLRQERQYGAVRLSLLLRRYHQTCVSPTAIPRILREHRMPPVSLKRFRPGPTRPREILVPGQSVQVDVKHLKLETGRLYQFTAIDEATRYRVLKIYDHSTIRSAVDFIDQVRQALPVAIQRIQTDHGSEFGTDSTWHLHDLGIGHKRIPPGCPEVKGYASYCTSLVGCDADLLRRAQAESPFHL
jgi:transposase-like protein